MGIPLDEFLGVTGAPVGVFESGPRPTPAVLVKVAKLAAWLALRHDGDVEPPARVFIKATRLHGRLEWIGALERHQVGPFVEALRSLATGEIDLDTPATVGRVRELRREVCLGVAVTPECPYCPAVAAAVLRLALVTPLVSATVLRADTVPAPPDIRAVPAVFVGRQVLHVGPIGEYALADRVALWAESASQLRR